MYALAQQASRSPTAAPTSFSGVVTCTGKDGTTAKATGATLDTSTIGLHVFTVQSTDVAGNLSTKAFQYRVAYAICLKYDPTQAKNIGSTVALALQICDAQGTNLSAASHHTHRHRRQQQRRTAVAQRTGWVEPDLHLHLRQQGEDVHVQPEDRQPLRQDAVEELAELQDLHAIR